MKLSLDTKKWCSNASLAGAQEPMQAQVRYRGAAFLLSTALTYISWPGLHMGGLAQSLAFQLCAGLLPLGAAYLTDRHLRANFLLSSGTS